MYISITRTYKIAVGFRTVSILQTFRVLNWQRDPWITMSIGGDVPKRQNRQIGTFSSVSLRFLRGLKDLEKRRRETEKSGEESLREV